MRVRSYRGREQVPDAEAAREQDLEATRNYRQYDGEDDGEMNMDDYEEVEMEEEKPKNQPDEDGWIIV